MSMTSAMGTHPRRRVRTPGKLIVSFMAGAVIVVGGATSVLRSIEHQGAAVFDAGDPLAPVKVGGVTYAPLDEFLVDLAPDRDGRKRYAKLSVSIAFTGGSMQRAAGLVAARRPEIDERLTFLLRNLQPEDFEGADGMARVKAEMLRRANIALAPETANDVVISDLVVQ